MQRVKPETATWTLSMQCYCETRNFKIWLHNVSAPPKHLYTADMWWWCITTTFSCHHILSDVPTAYVTYDEVWHKTCHPSVTMNLQCLFGHTAAQADLSQTYSHVQWSIINHLRSATHWDLLVPRMRTVTYGPKSFAVSGPTVWNTLPSTLCVSTTTLGQFQSGVYSTLKLSEYCWQYCFVWPTGHD